MIVLKGGRGSIKSTFSSVSVVWLLINNPQMHALVMRQVANTLRDSVYSQITWAINELNNYFPDLKLSENFKCTTSPLEITYLPTGQKIYFRGADDPIKIKSIKPPFGHIGILWFEELDQFKGQEAVRNIEQSAIRGGDTAYIFKSFNPPKSESNWVNKFVKIPNPNQGIYHSDYTTVPPEWLGKVFIDEALFLKEINPAAYEHEYLGVVTGTGGMVFDNIEGRAITDEEIAQFDRVYQGVDWGYFPDPFAWVKCHYDAARLTLYIFDEYKAVRASNRETFSALTNQKRVEPNQRIICDSAEPKSIADFREYGFDAVGAEKGPESVTYSMKWLQSLKKIVIDPTRCPECYREFSNYEHEQDKDGEFISSYPDKDNHFIDAARYAMNLIWRRRGQ